MVLSLRRDDLIVALVLGMFVLSAFEFLNDPYYHRTKVNFWLWAEREIIELFEGEKE